MRIVVDIDDEDIESIKSDVGVSLYQQIIRQMDVKQLTSEIKNRVVKELKNELSQKVSKDIDIEQIVSEAKKITNDQISKRVSQMLERGFNLKVE